MKIHVWREKYIEKKGDFGIPQLIGGLAALVAALHCWALFSPDGNNWGINMLAFLPPGMQIFLALAMLACLIPSLQRRLVRSAANAMETFSSFAGGRKTVITAVAFSCTLVLFWIGREGVTFLGDQFYLLRSLLIISNAEHSSSLFPHEPLAGYLVWILCRLFAYLGTPDAAKAAYITVSIAAGGAFLIALRVFSGVVTAHPQHRFWFYAFIMATAGTQLFFGYVENYVLSYVGLLVFLLLGVRYIRGEGSLLIPSALFGVLISLYIGLIAFAPSILFLIIHGIRRKKWLASIASPIVMMGVCIAMLQISTSSPSTFFGRLTASGSHFVPLAAMETSWQGYSMFSVRHALEIVNVNMLLSPFALVLVLILPFYATRQWKNAEWLFIVLTAACGLGMIAVFQSDIGMCRDWDLLSVFGLSVVIAVGYLVVHSSLEERRKTLALAVITAITMIHTTAFVLVNADSDRAMARFKNFTANSLWGTKAFFSAHEELAIYYRDAGRYREAAEEYEAFMVHDSTNGRVLGGLADVYRKLGDADREVYYIERTLKYQPSNKNGYLRLSELYSKKGHTKEATEMALRGMSLDRPTPQILSQLGLMSVELRQDYTVALEYFRRAISMDSTYADAYLKAGLASQNLGQFEEMKRYLSRYLQLQPASPNATRIRELMNGVR